MSFFGDVLGFESFNAKDMWNKVRKDPERLLIGAGDPWSTKMWNGILDKNYEPLVDQMGGAYGGHTVSAFGNNDGGVYKRAQDAGINTGPGGSIHDVAHVVSAIYGGQGLLGAGGAGSAPAGGGNLGIFSNGGQAGMTGVGQGNVGQLFANTGINTGGVGGVGGVGSNASLGAQDWMKLAQMGGGQQQPQQQAQPMPQPAPSTNGAFLAHLQRQKRAQELRGKVNRTAEENQELRELTGSGLLG